MAIPNDMIQGPMPWLADTWWYCPAPFLPAVLLLNGPSGPILRPVQDQTIWHITTAANGYLLGQSATNIGGTWSYATIVGSVTPLGGVSLSFTPDEAVTEGPDGLQATSLTIGVGEVVGTVAPPFADPIYFLMQMSSGSGIGSLTHWAYMDRMAPGDAVWADLPGTVPRGVEEVFRTGSTAGSSVPGVISTGNGRDEALFGSNRADQLHGAGGSDTLTAGSGRDALCGGGGNDLLRGDAGRDTLLGGAGADTLAGGEGADVLRGDAGADRLVLAAPPAGGTDRILGFAAGEDLLVVSAAAFRGGLAPGALPADRLVVNDSGFATAAFGQFVHETDRGVLWWDADGTGFGPRLAVALLPATPALTASDFLVIA